MRFSWKGAAIAVMLPALGGCISLKTPDKPIEINLNVDIKQEVLVRLQRERHDGSAYEVIQVEPGSAYLGHLLRTKPGQ